MTPPVNPTRGPTTAAPHRLHRLGVVVALVVVVLIAAAVGQPSTERRPVRISDQTDVDQVGVASYSAPSRARRDRSMPVAAGLGAASTTWFCGGAPAAATTLVLTNRAPRARSALVTAVTSETGHATRRVSVPAYSSRNFPVDFAGEGTVAAIVESRHGGLVASMRISGDETVTTAACATASSDSWFFAGGDTQRGATETLVLFNPFDDLATADVTFLTPDGFRRPQPTQGLAVPGRTVVLIDVGEVQNRRSDLGAVVTTRSGRLVAWRHQSFDGTGPELADGAPPKGVSLALGAPTPLTRFALPTAVTGSGVAPRIVLANPGVTTATVRLTFAVDDPASTGQPPATTVELLSGAVEVLDTDELRQVASGVSFSVSGRVVRGGAVVAELWLGGSEPASGHGAFAAPAFGLSARSWIAPVGLELPVLDQLGIDSAGRSARLRLWVIVDGERRRITLPEQASTVPANGRVTIDLAALLEGHPGAAVELRSSSPVTVSRLQTGPDEQGLVSTPAVPISGGLADP